MVPCFIAAKYQGLMQDFSLRGGGRGNISVGQHFGTSTSYEAALRYSLLHTMKTNIRVDSFQKLAIRKLNHP